MVNLLKGNPRVAFVILTLLLSVNIKAQSSINDIVVDPQWIALLHIDESGSRLNHEYLLSGKKFSSKNELLETLNLFLNNPSSTLACHYIARHYYLANIKKIKLPPIDCPDYWEFSKKAPIDTINIIFASENLSQPASIMGHTMLSISDANGLRQHSVSFSTDIDTYNPFKLIWDNLVKGQPGDFLIKPLSINTRQYLDNEQRNLWSYGLVVTQQDRQLLQRHIWELKFTNMTYLFQSHNCATLTLDLLRVIKPSIGRYRQNWLSPIDVIKAAYNEDLISRASLQASSKWKVRLLSNFSEPLMAKDIIHTDEPKTILSGLLAHNINRYKLETGQISLSDWRIRDYELQKKGLISQYHSFEIEDGDNPIYRPNDSQWGLSVSKVNVLNFNQPWYSVFWMPASHQIMDNNKQYSSENELQLLNISLRTNGDQLQLKHANLYSVQSYLDSNPYIGGLSGKFAFGINRFNIDNSIDKLAMYFNGGLGKTYSIQTDISAYSLWNIGFLHGKNYSTVVNGPEIGLLVRLIGQIKSKISANKQWYSHDKTKNEYSMIVSINKWEGKSFQFNFSHEDWTNKHNNQAEIGIRFFY